MKTTSTPAPIATPAPVSATTPAPIITPAPIATLPTEDIPTTAQTLGFTMLVAALQAVNMALLFAYPPNPGPLTVFAPSNAAFDLLGDELLECLLLPKYVLVLQDILSYHYAYGKVLAGDLTNDQVITMANGKDIQIKIIPGGGVVIKYKDDMDATTPVSLADVMATNGVIHAIDNVLIPPGLDVEGLLEECMATDPPEPTPSPTTKSSKRSKKGKASIR